MFIHVYNRQKDLVLHKSSVRGIVQATLEHLKAYPQEVAIYFVTEKKITELHDQFFEDPTPTDCISFPMDEDHLGEVFVCPSTAVKYAHKHNLDPYHETALYIIHGLLHLLGFDDLEEKARRIMRKKEKSCKDYINKQGVGLRPA